MSKIFTSIVFYNEELFVSNLYNILITAPNTLRSLFSFENEHFLSAYLQHPQQFSNVSVGVKIHNKL